MNTIKDNTLRTKYAIVFQFVLLFTEVTLVIAYFFRLNILEALEKGNMLAEYKLESNTRIINVLDSLYFIIFILSLVTFIMWFRRTYYNLHKISLNLLYDESAAAISWFIPFVNFYKPFRIMLEIFAKSQENLKLLNIPMNNNKGLIIVWWIFWVISGIISSIVTRWSMSAYTFHELKQQTEFTIFSGVLSSIQILLLLLILKEYSKIQIFIQNFEIEKYKLHNQIGDDNIS